jgi:hypothetical protein
MSGSCPSCPETPSINVLSDEERLRKYKENHICAPPFKVVLTMLLDLSRCVPEDTKDSILLEYTGGCGSIAATLHLTDGSKLDGAATYVQESDAWIVVTPLPIPPMKN